MIGMIRKLTALRTVVCLCWTLSPACASPIHELVPGGESYWSGTAIIWIGDEGYTVFFGPADVLTGFLNFDLTGYAGTANSATLGLTGYLSGGAAPFSYTLWDVNAALWGTGSLYGSIGAGQLEPVPAHSPEPGTWFLLGGGLLAGGLLARRRRGA